MLSTEMGAWAFKHCDTFDLGREELKLECGFHVWQLLYARRCVASLLLSCYYYWTSSARASCSLSSDYRLSTSPLLLLVTRPPIIAFSATFSATFTASATCLAPRLPQATIIRPAFNK